jgi:hypothetical protein
MKRSVLISGALLLLIILGVLLFILLRYQNGLKRPAVVQSTVTSKGKVSVPSPRDMVEEVGKIVLLPDKETPQVALVSDVNQLKGQAFFADAINGDWVLVYNNAKLAILYRPSLKKIVRAVPVTMGDNQSALPTPSGGPKITFVLRNGTTVVGFTKTYQSALLKKLPNAQVTARDNATSSAYEKTLLVDIKGNAPLAKQVAQTLGISMGQLPEGEEIPASPSADFLIILGSDIK